MQLKTTWFRSEVHYAVNRKTKFRVRFDNYKSAHRSYNKKK